MTQPQLIFSDNVAGVYHHKPDLFVLAKGDPVDLIKEPQNQYDPRAIKVWHKDAGMLGYIPAVSTIIFHQAWANGLVFQTTIADWAERGRGTSILIRSVFDLAKPFGDFPQTTPA